MKKCLIVLGLFVVLLGCKSTKKVTTTTDGDTAVATLIASHYENSLDFETLSAKLRVKYRDNRRSQNVTVSVRAKKDEVIWINASLLGISLARAKITPTEVAFYEKVNGRYFEGDFEFLSRYFGVTMTFKQLQRLLLGETVFDLRERPYQMTEQGKNYLFTPRQQLEIADVFFLLAKSDLRVQQQRVTQPGRQVALDVDYRSYQEVGGKPFPENLYIKAQKKQDQTLIDVTYRNVRLDEQGLRFPFKIPNGYSEIKL